MHYQTRNASKKPRIRGEQWKSRLIHRRIQYEYQQWTYDGFVYALEKPNTFHPSVDIK